MIVYGIRSCDTCRKARRWLDDRDLDHDWVDLREDGVTTADLRRWLKAVGPDALVNRRSTTWRQLAKAERPAMQASAVLPVLQAHPTLVKRPVFERGDEVRVGFSANVRDWLERS
ncbi:Spx/MgsR family RNA polymerase-binding regulatory protein [Halomonas denitrificans]|nr:Spx/MgsR family RNA polymerase-binding regulatory protein [Halomonas denitrificans]